MIIINNILCGNIYFRGTAGGGEMGRGGGGGGGVGFDTVVLVVDVITVRLYQLGGALNW